MKRILLFMICSLSLSSFQVKAQKDKSLELKDPSSLNWFKEAKFGMFIHWGLYSALEGSYKGKTMPDKSFPQGESWYAEWIKARFEIPTEEYKKLAGTFNPVKFNAEQWVKEAQNAGMRYLVITSKHHDGFALWDSKVSEFDIMKTPYKKDILAELVKACKKYGMKYGFYYSHWQDWEYPGGALPDWNPVRKDDEFEKYWQSKCLPQVKELIVNYNPDLLWFDTWDENCHITPERRDELIRLIRKYSSKCLINGRISYTNPGDNIDFLEMGDNAYPEKMLEKPWQTPATMQHSWGYHAKDYNWKSAKEMLTYLVHNISKGGNYLLNIGPKADGSFPVMATRRLREMGAWMYANKESIYNTQPVKNFKIDPSVFVTQSTKGNQKFIYAFLTKPMKELSLPLPSAKKCIVLGIEMPLNIVQSGDNITIKLPNELFTDGSIQVLKISL